MTNAPENTRGPPVPYIVDGRPFYNVQQAAQIIGTITHGTVWNWAKRGTPFGFDLGVKREPMIHHRPWGRRKAKTYRQYRMLIPEEKVFALKEILQDDPIRPGPLSDTGRQALEAAAKRFLSPLALHR